MAGHHLGQAYRRGDRGGSAEMSFHILFQKQNSDKNLTTITVFSVERVHEKIMTMEHDGWLAIRVLEKHRSPVAVDVSEKFGVDNSPWKDIISGKAAREEGQE